MSDEKQPKPLTLNDVKAAIAGSAAAFRCRTRLQPAGGDSSKVFPPTYSDGPYATEDRVVRLADGTIGRVPTVLLDSVQSQANRMELALLRGYREGKLKFPLIEVDFSECKGNTREEDLTDLVEITSLTAPHRIADAILRDSLVEIRQNGKTSRIPFSKSEFATRWGAARSQNATALFELCPTALVFGMWGSPDKPGGLGAKFSRAMVSEIVGFDVEAGKRPSSRIDPLGIEKSAGPVFRTTDGGWTIDPNDPNVLKEGSKPVLYARDKNEKNVTWKENTEQEQGNPSKINHGNIPPSLKREGNADLNPGGFTISHALQTTVLSLPALRRLSFPVDGKRSSEIDGAAQTTLAALALAAIAWQQREGYDLRSGCLLVPEAAQHFELLDVGEVRVFTLDLDGAKALLEQAVAAATALKLPWSTEPIKLTPSPNLQALIRKSRAKMATAPVEG